MGMRSFRDSSTLVEQKPFGDVPFKFLKVWKCGYIDAPGRAFCLPLLIVLQTNVSISALAC